LILTGNNRKYTNQVAEGRALPTLKEAGQMLFTFFLVVIGWIIFRAESIGMAWEYICGICDNSLFIKPYFRGNTGLLLNIIFLLVLEWIQRGKSFQMDLSSIRKSYIRWAIYLVLLFVLFSFGGHATNFIYFQF
jgi:D-alanyl-lipoteichoic acid acyltransferase DltB (MBOAT superfamily)